MIGELFYECLRKGIVALKTGGLVFDGEGGAGPQGIDAAQRRPVAQTGGSFAQSFLSGAQGILNVKEDYHV